MTTSYPAVATQQTRGQHTSSAKSVELTLAMWFNKQPGELPTSDEGFLLIGDNTPDVVKHPDGQVLKVLGTFNGPCPMTGKDCRHLILEHGWYVAESDKFWWYKK